MEKLKCFWNQDQLVSHPGIKKNYVATVLVLTVASV